MTENIETASLPSNRIAPKRARAALATLALIVRPPGQPSGIRAYTADEADEAQQYAAETGGVVDHLP